MKKDLKYYLGLNYVMEIRKLTKDEGSGWLACIPQLGRLAFCGDGNTIEEAIKSLNKIKKFLFKDHLDKNISIKEPKYNEN